MAKPIEDDGDVVVETRTREKTKRPPMYRVLMHNDDFTTRDFVVYVLMSVFRHSEASATRVMLHVHHNGVGVAGIYPYEIAESKVEKVTALARKYEFPLRCTLEEE